MESCGLDQLHPGIGFPGGSVLMNLPANAGDAGSIPGSRRSPEEGNNNPLEYSCLGNPIDSGAWRATVHTIAKSQTRLSDYAHTNTHTRHRGGISGPRPPVVPTMGPGEAVSPF